MKVLITGASRGLGRALSREFIARGASVWGVARSPAQPAKTDIGAGGSFFYTQCDCAEGGDIRRAAAEMRGAGFIPDVAVFNAGGAFDDAEAGLNSGMFRRNFELNLFGIVCWMEELLPFCLQRGSGCFAAISSLSVYKEGRKNRIAYSASKLALSKTFENMRLQYLASGVRFTVFTPGRLSDEGGGLMGATYDDAARFIAGRLAAGRCPARVDFPRLQYYLTRLARIFPDAFYHKYILK